MRALAITGMFLYAFANLFAATVDVARAHQLESGVALALFVTGLLLLAGGVMVWRRARRAMAVVWVALILAGGLAIFNERVLGYGHPSHHLVRGLITILLAWAATRASRVVSRGPSTATPDV